MPDSSVATRWYNGAREQCPISAAIGTRRYQNVIIIVDCELNVDYKLEETDPNDEPVTQEKEKADSNAKYVKMELPNQGTYKQRMTHCQLLEQIYHLHATQGPEIMAFGSKICTYSLELVPKQPYCLSESRTKIVQIGCESSLTRILMISVMYEKTRQEECQWNASQRATSFSYSPGEPEASYLPILS